MVDLKKIEDLTTSWTKYDIVQMVNIIANNEIDEYKTGAKYINQSVFKSVLGIDDIDDTLPEYWVKIYDYPQQVRLFAMIAALFTHQKNLRLFSEFSKGNMTGVLTMQPGDKHFTNLRSLLVEGGATEKLYRRKDKVPYDFSKLFEIGEIGKFVKEVIEERLRRVKFSEKEVESDFYQIAIDLGFVDALSLSDVQFINWTNGEGISRALLELEENEITYEKFGKIKGLKVKQWLSQWDDIPNFDTKNRERPKPYFVIFNIPAMLLKRLYGVHQRNRSVGDIDDQFSQRKFSEDRSREIEKFVQGGFPWSTISEAQRESESYKNLKMPGWLPTSIIANVLVEGSIRKGKTINQENVIQITELDDTIVELKLPSEIWSDKWLPEVPPIEIIDGQHRIKAFDYISRLDGNYELPVVSFVNLDFTWQAYLFYTINIKPKRINTSLAYDLIPLLRIQDWLEHDANGPEIYRKVRAQELTEILWKHPLSPWFKRINMLGDAGLSKEAPVSQNAYINSIISSFVKKWEGKIGGLYGAELHEGAEDVILWDKEAQGAFLIFVWQKILRAVKICKQEWALKLRESGDYHSSGRNDLDLAFTHQNSFFATDQGVRSILFIFNDMSFCGIDDLKLNEIYFENDADKYSQESVIEIMLQRLKEEIPLNEFLNIISEEITNNFDWRTSSEFDSSIPEQDIIRQNQNQFKGSSGYREMRRQLLKVLSLSTREFTNKIGSKTKISDIAQTVREKLSLY